MNTALERLRESEQRFRSLFMYHPDAVFALDVNSCYVELNPACERLTGFPPRELLGKPFGERTLAPEEPRRAIRAALEGTPVTFDSTIRIRDGSTRQVQTTLVPIAVDGLTVGVYGVAKDISERQRFERMLAAHALQQAAVADLGLLALTDIALEKFLHTAVSVVAAVLDVEVAALLEVVPDGELLFLRAGVGVPATMIGTTTSAVDSASLLAGVLERGEALRIPESGGDGRYVILFGVDLGAMTGLAARVPGQRDRSGVLVALTGRNRAFSDDEVAFSQAMANVLGATIDRNEAAEELRRRERELKVVVEHAADTIVRVDRQLRFLYLNPAAEQVMGFPASELIGRSNRVLPVAESLIDNWDLALRRAFRSGEEESFESMYPSPGGDRYFDVRVWPEFGPEGTVESLLCVGRDITASKQREVERAEIYKELLERDTRLHELLERALLNQQDPVRTRLRAASIAEQFNPRERQILRLLARGQTNRQIGSEIGLSPSTVKNYIASILPRLNATDRTHAAVLAAGLGLVDAES